MNHRQRQAVLKVAIIGLSGAVSLLIAEAVIRIALPFYSPARQIAFHYNRDGVPLGTPDSKARIATPKGDWDIVVTFNRYGLRDSKDLAQSKPGDLFVVGDSFAFGWGLEGDERFSDRLQRILRRPVYNVAIPGDIVDYQRLRDYAERNGAKIDRLIVALCMENDLRNYRADGIPVQTEMVQLSSGQLRKSLRKWFKMHSALYIALSHILQSKLHAGALLEKLGVSRGVEDLTARNEYSEVVLESSRDELLKLIGHRRGIVLIVPSRALWAGDNMATERKVHDRLVELLREAKVLVVDVRTQLEASGAPLDFYFKTDPHWNAKGHALAAQELADAVRKNWSE